MLAGHLQNLCQLKWSLNHLYSSSFLCLEIVNLFWITMTPLLVL